MNEQTGLPGRLVCPVCSPAAPADGNAVPHFWRFQEVGPEEERRWLLGLVCEAHHHWVIELRSDDAGIVVRQRTVPCPDGRSCGWNPDNWGHYIH
jgi:hypothetical protein